MSVRVRPSQVAQADGGKNQAPGGGKRRAADGNEVGRRRYKANATLSCDGYQFWGVSFRLRIMRFFGESYWHIRISKDV